MCSMLLWKMNARKLSVLFAKRLTGDPAKKGA
ncbi:hypothetical protein PR001_g8207 [Phytophthora rubi]|uniref:Uncharacterized protein n=1 Tax=Phytophthora rubi TaxID=129364 RepID=A0A6A3N888_9STRA|nr:hypothetical protein PR001_g8207 [Phytophthora rubi]